MVETHLTKYNTFSMKNPNDIPNSEIVLEFLNKGGVFIIDGMNVCLSEEDKLCAVTIEEDKEVLYELNVPFNEFISICNSLEKKVIFEMFLFSQEPVRGQTDD